MALTLVTTPAAADANSYVASGEATAYFESRLYSSAWDDAAGTDQLKALVMATRVVDAVYRGVKTLVRPSSGEAFYRVGRVWTGLPSTTTQKLAWPRTGMYDANGNTIPSGEIPAALKDAVSEFAGQLLAGDRTADNDAVVQGLTSLSAGSVSLSFKDAIVAQVLPDAVVNLMPPSWYTEETEESVGAAEFEVL